MRPVRCKNDPASHAEHKKNTQLAPYGTDPAQRGEALMSWPLSRLAKMHLIFGGGAAPEVVQDFREESGVSIDRGQDEMALPPPNPCSFGYDMQCRPNLYLLFG